MYNSTSNMYKRGFEAAAGGLEYLVCANIPTDTLDDLKTSIVTLNKTGEACKKAGIQFCYHNHDMEFKVVDGKVPTTCYLAKRTPIM